MKLKDQTFTPPKGWRYQEPSTGQVFSSIHKAGLVAAVKRNRIEKAIPIGNVEEDIENFICSQIPPNMCLQDGAVNAPQIVRASGLTVDNVRSFGESVAHIIKSGGVVSQQEADRRSAICASCPFNTTLPGCTACSGITGLILTILGARKSLHQDSLKQCGACGCSLSAKVWITKSDLEAKQQVKEAMSKYPPHCWMKQPAQS